MTAMTKTQACDTASDELRLAKDYYILGTDNTEGDEHVSKAIEILQGIVPQTTTGAPPAGTMPPGGGAPPPLPNTNPDGSPILPGGPIVTTGT